MYGFKCGEWWFSGETCQGGINIKSKSIILITLLLSSIIVLFCNIGLVLADTADSCYVTPTTHKHFVNATWGEIQGQTFNATSAIYVTEAYALLGRVGTDYGGSLIATIQGTGNSYTTAPNGTIYATSDPILLTSITAGDSIQQEVTFYFWEDYQLIVNEKYAFVITYDGASVVEDANSPYWWMLGSGSTHAGRSVHCNNVQGWIVSNAGATQWFGVAGNDSPQTTPGPLPTGGLNVDTTDADVVMSALIDYGVPVVVMILPVAFLFLVGMRGKWPFLMGIAIGTGMGYLFGLVPVWLVFIVSIVEVGMAYQSVRSG